MQTRAQKKFKVFDTPQWLLDHEEHICQQLAAFLTFEEHALFFPPDLRGELIYIPEEERLIMPFSWQSCRGALLLKGVRQAEAVPIIPVLQELLLLCLDNVALACSKNINPENGLADEDSFFGALEAAALGTQASFGNDLQDFSASLGQLCRGLIVICWQNWESLLRTHGLDAIWEIFSKIASETRALAPRAAIVSQLGKYENRLELGIILPVQSPGTCADVAEGLIDRLENLEFSGIFSHPSSPQPHLVAGLALFPQDMSGAQLRLPLIQQTMLLRDKARFAAKFALQLERKALDFHSIIKMGGRVTEIFDQSKLKINLGGNLQICPGRHFHVLTAKIRMPIARIVVLEVGEESAVAEILYLPDANILPAPGDRIIPVEDTAPKMSDFLEQGRLFSYDEFFTCLRKRKSPRFALALCQFGQKDESPARGCEILSAVLNSDKIGAPDFGGIYGKNSLIFYHEGKDAGECAKFYETTVPAIVQICGESAWGVFAFPYLDYGREDAEGCLLKALDYARLLPFPRIGAFGSVALNISGDKLASRNETFQAVHEYEQAILADPANAPARNSLGVILAGMGKDAEAARHFKTALKCAPDSHLKAKICYNLGALHEKSGADKIASAFYRRSLQLDSAHGFSLLRLGALYEKAHNYAEARRIYMKAMQFRQDDSRIADIAQRHLARLAACKNPSEAKELLHELLARSPGDIGALLLMARIYLAEDAQLSEMLARKALQLGGGKNAWEALAEALAAQGRPEDAAKAEDMAGRQPDSSITPEKG